MRKFNFNLGSPKEALTEENGWSLKIKLKKRLGLFFLKTPIMKEITTSKGVSVRYVTHVVLGVGRLDRFGIFKGMAFFDLHIRLWVFLMFTVGVSYSSGSFFKGLLWAFIFYVLIVFISRSDDEFFLNRAKRLCEKQ